MNHKRINDDSDDLHQFIIHLESNHKKTNDANRIRHTDMSAYLPGALRQRIAKCINLHAIQTQHEEVSAANAATIAGTERDSHRTTADDLRTSGSQNDLPESERSFNPSTLTIVQNGELQHEHFHLRIDPPADRRRPSRRSFTEVARREPPNRPISTMVRQKKIDRIKWPSKCHHADRNTTFFGRSELMFDLVADDFADWLANIGDPDEPTLGKNIIKQLFAIVIEGDTSKAMTVQPRVVRAIPDAMARAMEMPDLSLEYNVGRMLRSAERRKMSKPLARIAFGRSLDDDDMADGRFSSTTDDIRPVKPTFPHDLRSKKTVFDGITHLKATRELVDHLIDNPDIPRPEYLVDTQLFDAVMATGDDSNGLVAHVPLYKGFVN